MKDENMNPKTQMFLAGALVLLASYGAYLFLSQKDLPPPAVVQAAPTAVK